MFLLIVLEVIFLLVLVYMIFYLVSYKSDMMMENSSSYECGFDLNSKTRLQFSYRFFLISILFLVFDVEIALMLPVPFFSGVSGLETYFIFIFILILGLNYEYFYGSLNWL